MLGLKKKKSITVIVHCVIQATGRWSRLQHRGALEFPTESACIYKNPDVMQLLTRAVSLCYQSGCSNRKTFNPVLWIWRAVANSQSYHRRVKTVALIKASEYSTRNPILNKNENKEIENKEIENKIYEYNRGRSK